MQAGLLQLMALLTGGEEDSESEAEDSEMDEDARERLVAELDDDERREWEEYQAFEREEEQRERAEMADMLGWNDEPVDSTGVPTHSVVRDVEGVDDDGWEDMEESEDSDVEEAENNDDSGT